MVNGLPLNSTYPDCLTPQNAFIYASQHSPIHKHSYRGIQGATCSEKETLTHHWPCNREQFKFKGDILC